MASCTVMLAYELKKSTTVEDVMPVVSDLFSLVMDDVIVVYPSNGIKLSHGLAVAIGNQGKSQATLQYHSEGLLTLDTQHKCNSDKELLPMTPPYTLEYVRSKDQAVLERLENICQRSLSLFTPIRRGGRFPRNYAALADERLVETDYSHALCDIKSPFQRVRILQSRQFGRVLTLDDDVMFGESDEIYVTTVLGLDRGNNYGGATVLILGGGDGGLLYTLVSLTPPPKFVTMAEIDEVVMQACSKHMWSVCGTVLNNYKGDIYKIEVRDCIEVLKESVDRGEKYDYVINDLTEFSVNKEQYGFDYDFKTNNILMELSFKCLKEGGKYLARGNCSTAISYVEKIEAQFHDLGVPYRRFDRHVPSFRELYCFFEAENVTSNGHSS